MKEKKNPSIYLPLCGSRYYAEWFREMLLMPAIYFEMYQKNQTDCGQRGKASRVKLH
jgi:hypothetical protein